MVSPRAPLIEFGSKPPPTPKFLKRHTMGLSTEAIIAVIGVFLAVPSALLYFRGCSRHRYTVDLDKAGDRCHGMALLFYVDDYVGAN